MTPVTIKGKTAEPGWKVWGESRCDHCCNGDRCDDPSHYDRTARLPYGCPHCLNTGYALWTEAGRKEYEARYGKTS